MPSSDPPTVAETTPSDSPAAAQVQENPQGKNGEVKPATAPAAPATGETKMSNAELKKQAKAEKAARRQQALAEKQSGAPQVTVSAVPGPQQKAEQQKGGKGQHKRGASTSVDVRSLPVRGAPAVPAIPAQPKKEDKTVEFFRHLYKQRTSTIAGASKEVHPAVLALGLQMSNYTICGSCARLVATLQAFKRVSPTWMDLRIGQED